MHCYGVRRLFIIASASLTIFSTVSAGSIGITPVFPTRAVTALGSSSVNANLVEINATEMKQITAPLSKKLTEEEVSVAVSLAVQKENLQSKAEFLKTMGGDKHSQTLSFDQASEVLRSLVDHPIASKAFDKYDPKHTLGFCFGRAAYVHVELLRRGLDPKSIAKVFAVGSLYFRHSGWNYHMATMARGPGGTWWVIDGLQSKVMNLDEWMSEVTKWDGDASAPSLRFYFSDPAKFQAVPGTYEVNRLSDPMYNGFFTDLNVWFNSHPVTEKLKVSRFEQH